MKRKNSLQYSFLEESFNYLIALNRGLTQEKDNKEKVMESSFIRLCRLLYYSQLPNEYARVDHELHFIQYYLKQQSLHSQNKIQYKINSDSQNIYWASQRLELYKILEEMIKECAEESIYDFSIYIDASNLNSRKEIMICINCRKDTIKKKLRVRRMKYKDSRFYMIYLPNYISE